MKAEEIMTKNPATVQASDQVAEAVHIMKLQDCGVVPVVDPEKNKRVIGIVTDRDIALRACAGGGNGPLEEVSAVMSTTIYTVNPDDDLDKVMGVMKSAGVRRVPVCEDGELVGIISMKDLGEHLDEARVGNVEDTILERAPNN